MNRSPECGTVACIAGWAVAAFQSAGERELQRAGGYLPPVFCRAQEYLGLTNTEAYNLFTLQDLPEGHGQDLCNYHMERITSAQAVKTIRDFVEIGVVNWDHIKEDA
jgi:hypothetical protein